MPVTAPHHRPARTAIAALFATTALAAGPVAAADDGDVIELDEIVITPNRTATPADRSGAAVSVRDEAEIAADDRPFVLQQLTSMPGVTTSQAGPAGATSGFAIRGAPQQYVRVYVDGIEISDPTGPQVASSLTGLGTDGIGRMEVLRGSQSALYGGQAVAGVVDISTAGPTKDGLETRYTLEGGSFDTFRGELGLAGRDERGEFALNLTHYRTDGFSAVEADDGNPERDGYETTRLALTGRYATSDTVTIFASAFQQHEKADYDMSFPAYADADYWSESDQWGARAGLDIAPPASLLTHHLAISYYDVEREFHDDYPYKTDGNRVRAEYLGTYDAGAAVGLQYGLDWSQETSTPSDGAREDSSITGIFAQADWAPTNALTVNAALRNDSHSEFGSYTTGRLTAAYLLPSATVLRASLGTGFRPPSLYELYDPFAGDSNLDPETSRSADIGIEQAFADGRGQATATLFWLEIDDLIEYDYDLWRYVQSDGTAKSSGVELSASWALAPSLSLSGAYTYTDATDADGAHRDRIPRHALSLSLDGTAMERISYGLEARYSGDYTDSTGPAETANFHNDFLIVNARAGYAISDAAELYVRVENLLDAEYQTVRGYGTSDQAVFLGVRGIF
ncbi:TonB-dependent receptor [Rhodobacteraceae bacterium DSL-40]|uniref:TonB-dependent receptor plug domain-containing protein n=1 Tax=Amaricoccus sp. B4 TaxID=3368557 RepID=UPI000DAD54B2